VENLPHLLSAVVAGDARASDRLLEAWAPTVLRWCARLGGPAIDPEDAAHDVFANVFARLHTLRYPERFPAWLYQTTRRVVIDHRRRAWLRRWVPGLVPDVEDDTDGPARRAERSDLAREVWEALDALPQDLREVLVLCEIEERDGVEVATLVGLPLGTVRSRLRRARARFEVEARRRGLGPDGEGTP
jgi:RNA polymerase sigma-70 factor (ECF subfamily)